MPFVLWLAKQLRRPNTAIVAGVGGGVADDARRRRRFRQPMRCRLAMAMAMAMGRR